MCLTLFVHRHCAWHSLSIGSVVLDSSSYEDRIGQFDIDAIKYGYTQFLPYADEPAELQRIIDQVQPTRRPVHAAVPAAVPAAVCRSSFVAAQKLSCFGRPRRTATFSSRTKMRAATTPSPATSGWIGGTPSGTPRTTQRLHWRKLG